MRCRWGATAFRKRANNQPHNEYPCRGVLDGEQTLGGPATEAGGDQPVHDGGDRSSGWREVEPEVPSRYTLIRKIGEGGMGVVYQARDAELDREVALKLLVPRNRPTLPPAAEQRLVREARAMARLNHPHVVEVFDVGRHAGRHGERVYIAMELVPGPTLHRWLRAPRTWQDVLAVFTPAGRALAAAHAADLVHRDFKPSNVIVGDDGRVRVLDFGLARAATDTISATAAPRPAPAGTQTSAASEDDDADSPSLAPLSERVTEDGLLLGTPAYMSPEQHCGDLATPRSDQFAFCIALYEALYGRHPFAGDTPPATIQAKLHGHVVGPPRRSPVPSAVAAVVKRGLQADPNDRWPTMADLVDALERARGQTHRRALAVGATVVVALTGWLTFAPGRASVDPRCAGGSSALADVWNAERAASIEAAITGTGVGYASAAASRVSAGVERWAADWTAAWGQACQRPEAGDAPDTASATLDQAMLCLQRDLHTLDAHAERLETIDAAAVARSPSAVAELPDPARCLDADDGLPPPPEDIADDVELLQVELAHAESLRQFGKPILAHERAQSVAERAQALGWAPLNGDAKAMLAMTLADVGRQDDAEQAMLDAYFVAVETSDELAAVSRASMLIDQAARRPDGFDDAEKWYRRVTSLVDDGASGPVLRHLAFAHTRMATALRRAGRYDEAIERAREGLALAEEVMGNEPASMLHFYTDLAGPLVMQQRLDEGLVLLERALEAAEEGLGATHPYTGAIHSNYGDTLGRVGRDAEAIEHLRQSVEIFEASHGPDSDRVAMAATNLGVALDRIGRTEDAVAHWERARAILEANDSSATMLASLDNNLGRAWTNAGQLDKGRRSLQRALTRREADLGPEHPKVASVRINLAHNHRSAGALDDAARELERALSLLRVAHGDDGQPLATPLRMLADVRREQGDCTAARDGYRAALAILDGERGEGEVDPEGDADRARAGLQACDQAG